MYKKNCTFHESDNFAPGMLRLTHYVWVGKRYLAISVGTLGEGRGGEMIVKRRTINQYIFSENRRRRKSCNRTKQKLYTYIHTQYYRITVVLASTSGKAKPFVIRPSEGNDARSAAVVTERV